MVPHLNSLYMAPSGAPFSGLCPRLRSLCKGRKRGCLSPVSGMVHPGGRCRRIRRLLPPCVPHRHARRAVRGVKRKGRSDALSLPPCRRRETTFREPSWRRLTSFPHHKRRPRLAATPCSVSVAGWEDCRHRFSGRGKAEHDFFEERDFRGAWILGSSPRMTEGRSGFPVR